MPKFYINDGVERVIIDDKNPEYACVRSLVIGKFSSFIVNGYYIVSEKGFDCHDDDIVISSNIINNAVEAILGISFSDFLKYQEDNEKKDEDNT